MIVFDGKLFAQVREENLKLRVAVLKEKGISPKMISVLGDNSPESALYVSLKEKFAQRVGIDFEVHHFEFTEKAERIVADIQKANHNDKVQGIMVQLPISEPLTILREITPLKDIDCLTPENNGLVMRGKARFLPAAVKATIEVLKEALAVSQEEREIGGWLAGKNICLVGASEVIGKPLSMVLSDLGGTVLLCRSSTKDLSDLTQAADILISATGSPSLINEGMVKKETIVIDVGISRLLREGRYRVMGDVDPEVAQSCAFITPVPGGVGPVTVVCLFENLLDAIEK